ncbi:MAG: TIGR01212 family radical SAM protein [Candidatus Omnitrophica bacterium]|nr:TIGR01212 family radical SAM protein [Candidatus Omnitrophota bacterium]
MLTDKPYYTFGNYLKERFGCRVHKVAIDAGFTCPNLDGIKGKGGCTYCNNEGFSYNSRILPRPISEQIDEGIEFNRRRFKAKKFLAYFQAHTNTYAPVNHLKKIYDEILPYEDIVSFAVGTRPDCISLKSLDLLESYSERFEVWVEYGLQSSHNRTLQRVNRCDTYERFLWAIDATSKRNLKVCVHVILGLPGETREDMMETAERLAPLPFHSIKVHLLHIMKNTPMEREYNEGLAPMFTMQEYARVVCDFLERLPADISIQRLTADAPPDVLVAPKWCLERQAVYQAIEDEFARRGTRQGSLAPPDIRENLSWREQARQIAPMPVVEVSRMAS